MSNPVFYIAAKASGEEGGIYRYLLEGKIGARLRGFAAQPFTNFLLYSQDGERLYAGGGEPKQGGFAATYRIGPDGALRKEAEFAAEKSNCHLLQVGDFLYSANYHDGSFSEFRLVSGMVAEETNRIAHSGSGPVKDRQEAAHIHSCNLAPDGKYLVVLDLGSDTISSYALSRSGVSGRPAYVAHASAGDGPRHMLFSGDGKTAYILNELSNTVGSWHYEKGKFTFLGKTSTLPRFFRGSAYAAAIRFDPACRLIYVTNRGFDAVAVFSPEADGALKSVSLAFAGGKVPRDGNFVSPQCYCTACEESDEVVFFDVRAGNLSPNGIRLVMPHPLYVLSGSGRPKSEKLHNTPSIRLDKKLFSRYIVGKNS